MADYDGDLSNVNPDLLKLCANADDWREQRRRAMKAKIFGGSGGVESETATSADAYLPSEAPAHTSASASTQIPASQQATESYILQQILSHKRRRDDANQPTSTAPASFAGGGGSENASYAPQQQQQQQQQAEGELSLKERLMRKYNKN